MKVIRLDELDPIPVVGGELQWRPLRRSLGIGDAPLLCAVARLDDEKGVESAVRALARVPADAHLAVVGEGPLRVELMRIARQLGVDGRLHLLGMRDDVEEVLAAATVVVAPT